MSLDQNLFTLNFTQDEQNPQLAHLIDPSGTPHYTRQRISSGTEYKIEVYGVGSCIHHPISSASLTCP